MGWGGLNRNKIWKIQKHSSNKCVNINEVFTVTQVILIKLAKFTAETADS